MKKHFLQFLKDLKPYAIGFAVLLLLSFYLTWMPGSSYKGPITLSPQDKAYPLILKQHVEKIAFAEHNAVAYKNLEKSENYIFNTLSSYGFTPNKISVKTGNLIVNNIEIIIEPETANPSTQTVVIGAHYDSAEDAVGANDNASGAAILLELAKKFKNKKEALNSSPKYRLRLVWFVNEEPPYFKTQNMGSLVYVQYLLEKKEKIKAMYSFDVLGSFYETPSTQKYPLLFSFFYPSTGNFVAFVGNRSSKELVQKSLLSFRNSNVKIGSEGISAPQLITGIDFSDHWSFYKYDIPALMITDTAWNRYSHYHKPTDTPDKLNYAAMSVALSGLEKMYYELFF